MFVVLSKFISFSTFPVSIYNSATKEPAYSKPDGTELNWIIPNKQSGEYLRVHNPYGFTGTYYTFQYCGAVYCVQDGWERKVCSIPIIGWFSSSKVKVLVDSSGNGMCNMGILIDKNNK